MSELLAVPIDFESSLNVPVPTDPALYSMVLQWCEQNLAEVPNFKKLYKTIAVIEQGDNGELIAVHHVSALRYAPDIPVFRSAGPYAKQVTKIAFDRWQAWCADNGWRGQDVMIWIDGDEKPEQQCENREGSIKAFDLRPSKRMLVKVR